MDFKLPQIGKAPVAAMHFPSRLQAFIFRASEFVSFEKIASLVKTNTDNIKKAAAQMGIYNAENSDIWLKKGYITIIRSMWHLLPYSQLTELLDTDESSLAVLLREEDFLDQKLGYNKPDCEPIVWHELTKEEQKAAELIKSVMSKAPENGVRAFDFKYTRPDIKFSGDRVFDTRMIYLFSGLYQTAFDVDSEEYCTDEMLESYQRLGINAVWTQGILFGLSEFPFDKTVSEGYEKRIERLEKFTRRLDKFGIKLFLYLNEPRCMPEDFFKKYPELRGHKKEKDKICMCTSTEKVQNYIKDSVESICRKAPLIGGFFTITRSENLTNCYAHSNPDTCECPRCKKRGVGEVIGEVISCIREGADRVSRDIKVIAWSWAWNEYNIDIINHLPSGVIFQSQSELHVPFEIGGVKGRVSDYSMGIIGPGERAKQEWAAAKARGLEISAKLQANTTWEGSTVPALPVFPLVEEHIKRIKEQGVRHIMLSWTLGGYPSENLMHAAKYFNQKVEIPQPSDNIRNACEIFSRAFREFPFDIKVLYKGPQNAGPSNLLYDKPTGYEATMTCYAYDDIEHWRSIYPTDVFENQLDKLCSLWERGLDMVKNEPECETIIMAKAAYCLYKSSRDQVRFYLARDKNDTESMRSIAQSELETANEMLELMNKNAAIGFEAANHYYFSKRMICEKIINCKYLLQKSL